MDAALFLHFGCSGVSGAEASGRLWPWRLPDIGRDRLGQQVRAPAPRVGCTARGQRGGPESGVEPRQAYKMSKFAGATWSRSHRPPAELSGRGPR